MRLISIKKITLFLLTTYKPKIASLIESNRKKRRLSQVRKQEEE